MESPSDEKRTMTEPLLINQSPKGGIKTIPFIIGKVTS